MSSNDLGDGFQGPPRANLRVGGAGISNMDRAPTSTPRPSAAGSLAAGIQVIETTVKTLPTSPGVYRMINAAGDVLYVGKAKHLKKRVASYASPSRLSIRLARMVAATVTMEFVTTHTEAEALLLEANLIKRFHPRYNILLRDDKSFPSIHLTSGHSYPRVVKHRGARKAAGDYFGPFASAGAVNQSLTVLEQAFLLRSCSDSVFDGRTRPCLLYQIKRCSAPCVDHIGKTDYDALVDQARTFLSGGSRDIQNQLAADMQTASDALEFEVAAQLRDRIGALTRIQARQDVNLPGIEEADVIAAHQAGGNTCIQVFFFRGGRNNGNCAYYPSHSRDEDAAQVLAAFIAQFYDNKPPPRLVLLSHRIVDQALMAEALGVRAGRKVAVRRPERGDKRALIDHALRNAREGLSRRLAHGATHRRLLEDLGRLLAIDPAPERIEVFDNSHISGSQAVGAMIVAGPDGLEKKSYRKFTIRQSEPPPGKEEPSRSKGEAGGDATDEGTDAEAASEAAPGPAPADDYAMMRQVLGRRYGRVVKEDPDRSRGQWPDLVLIDGGLGHLNVALEVFADLGIGDLPVAAIAKGPDRNAGRERIFLPGREPIQLQPRDSVLYFLQRLRDEAHRFVIGAHRGKRRSNLTKSSLDDIPGIGAKRKKALLHHFGSARGTAEAGRTDLEEVDGISRATANKIYDWFHPEG
jgi:excinuclease ABC subunit C